MIIQPVNIAVGNVQGTPAIRTVSATVTGSAMATGQAVALPSSGSRAGDETALDDLSASLGGLDASWNTPISLASPPTGVTVATVNSELRVTEINLKDQGITGSIDNASLGNLTEMEYLNVCFNSLNTQFPQAIGNCTSLRYLYLCISDNVESKSLDPHEHISQGGGDLHPGKSKGTENNIITGGIPSDIQNCPLEYFVCNWTDSSSSSYDGLSSIAPELFNITSFIILQIYNNNNITPIQWPTAIGNMTNLNNLALGMEKADNRNQFIEGSVDHSFANCTNLRFIRLQHHPNLTLDFNTVDMSGMTSLRNCALNFLDITGDLPAYFYDGTMPNLVGLGLNFPRGSGLTGNFPSGPFGGGMTIVQVGYGNSIGGSIPASFWTANQNLIQTEFYGNSLTSLGTSDLTGMNQLRNLRFENNDIGPEPWPNLDWASSVGGFNQAQFGGNKYVFSDMLYIPFNAPAGETIFELYQTHADSVFTYGNQQAFGSPAVYEVSTGSNLTIDDFDAVVTHANNVYQWQKDGSNISGATSRSLSLSNIQSSDAGIYNLVVTNPGVSGLTLRSVNIEIQVV